MQNMYETVCVRKSRSHLLKCSFQICLTDVSPAFVGFAGYFNAVLYEDVHLGIEPSTATPNMFSW